MNTHTQLSTKFAALGLALMVNGAMIGGVAYLFSGQIHDTAPLQALAHTPAAAVVATAAAKAADEASLAQSVSAGNEAV